MARLRSVFGVEVPITWLFEAPTIARLSQRVEGLLRGVQGSEMPALVPVERTPEQDLLLSFAQQRLWFLDQLEPGTATYIIPSAVRLRGQMDRMALAAVLDQVIRRHENLRTTFPSQQGRPVQQIAAEPTTGLVILDLRHLGAEVREREARRLAQQEVEAPFDLGRGPPLRARLLRLGEQDQVLLLSMHHIISDGWSSGVLIRELSQLYLGRVQGEAVTLPALPIQYVDYALWQRNWLQGAVLQEQLDYWKRSLEGIVPLELPTDHPRPVMQSARGARQRLRLSRELGQQVRALSQQVGVTPFMTLLAVFEVLLARYSGQHDIAVGTPIANRTREEVEGLIGFFVNTLVLRTDLSGNPTFLELLNRVRTVALGAYSHQDLPFEHVVDTVQPQRDLSRSPLFQVFFALQNTPEVS
ncbi:MAG TPA: condensation domain-containing protein, partial [Gemmatimonadales bacterium]|nr:condensation domain-containing protein [Gemmatimonadales bacterium]